MAVRLAESVAVTEIGCPALPARVAVKAPDGVALVVAVTLVAMFLTVIVDAAGLPDLASRRLAGR